MTNTPLSALALSLLFLLIGMAAGLSGASAVEFNKYERHNCAIKAGGKLHCVRQDRWIEFDFHDKPAVIATIRHDLGNKNTGVCMIGKIGKNVDIRCRPK